MKKIVLLIFIFLFLSINSSYCVEDKVVAIVNGEVITKAELNMYINLIKLQIGYDGWEKLGLTERKALESLIEDKLILQEAKNKEIEIAERLIESRIKNIKDRFSSEDEFSDFLLKQGLSLSELKGRIKEQMLSDKLITMQIRNRVFVSPTEVTEYYQNNIKDFYLPEGVNLEGIFVREQDLSQEIYINLKQGADFIQMQKQYSKGSNLGLVYKGQLRKDIEEVVFNLEVGEFSEPLEIPEGYYIFLVQSKIVPSKKELVEVQDSIREMLLEMKFKKRLDEWIDKLKKKSYIVIKDE